MEIAVFVRSCGLVPQHKPYKKTQPNNHYNWKQFYRYVHSNSKSSYMIQGEREEGRARSRLCAPAQGGSCTQKTHSACIGWKRLPPLSSPKQVGISHSCPSPLRLPLSEGAKAAFGEHRKCPWLLHWAPGKEKTTKTGEGWGSAYFSLADWSATGWQRLNQEQNSDFFFPPTEVFTPEWCFSLCMVPVVYQLLEGKVHPE